MTKIEWTDETWNPLTGCSVVSPGCTNCYAMRMAPRLEAMGQENYAGATKNGKWTGQIKLLDEVLEKPLKWRKPRRVFVNSMSDLFHQKVPFEFIDKVFAIMALCPQHTFQVLTKRIGRMVEYVRALTYGERQVIEALYDRMKLEHAQATAAYIRWFKNYGVLDNVLIGPSVEDQKRCYERLPDAVRLAQLGWRWMLSVEPLLGPVDLSAAVCDWWESSNAPAWVIVGGESGPAARPMHPDWARSLRDQCVDHGVPFFFKQWGEWIDLAHLGGAKWQPMTMTTGKILDGPHAQRTVKVGYFENQVEMFRIGKKQAGRKLDGRLWSEMPK